VGLGHRIFGIAGIYGHFATTPRSLLEGPFVNSNHTAEFLELAAFTCLACAYQRNTALNRYGWLTGTLLCAAGAIATVSRGAVVGIVMGMLMFGFLRFMGRDGREGPRSRAWLAGVVLVALLVVVTAGALGAGVLVDRFRASSVSEEARFRLWRDSFGVLGAHPLGIGRGAFAHVYPVYRTLRTSTPATFEFVENTPLQLLIDAGWPLYIALLGALAIVINAIARQGRRDHIEAALLAGLFAVFAHSFVDFGLELLGVLLPFMAILGTVLGRCVQTDEHARPQRAAWPIVGLAAAGMLFGVGTLAHGSADNFDKLLKEARGAKEVRAVLARAQAVHPTDYFYPLAYAATEPLRPPGGGRSPRLHMLNIALRLCPSCEIVHVEVARSLWKLGSHSQSIIEWRTAVQLQPLMLDRVMDELDKAGAKPQEIAAVASFDARKMVDVATFLSGRSKVAEALIVLDQADAMGAPRADSVLTRCRLLIQAGQVEAARTAAAEAHAAGIQDPRLAVIDAQLIVTVKGAAGADEALSLLDLAATRYPLDLPVERLRIQIVSDYAKWQAADRALDGFKLALYNSLGDGFEANVAAARIRGKLGQWTAALNEYRIALSKSGDPWLWFEFGETAERAGRESLAREAYGEAARQAPNVARITDALRRLEKRQSYTTTPVFAPGTANAAGAR
jgi:tetratricopeptide (TPR) repeat protein